MEIDKSIIKAAADYALIHFQKGSRWSDSYDTGKIRQEILESVIEVSWAKAEQLIEGFSLLKIRLPSKRRIPTPGAQSLQLTGKNSLGPI